MKRKLVIFDSHPVQYRAPLYRRLNELLPGSFEVVYATDCSVRGHLDEGFGKTFSWDAPLLEGYPNRVLNCENGMPLKGRKSLSGKGVAAVFGELRPAAILLVGFAYDYDWATYVEALRQRIPVWIRMETQDEAFSRTKSKAIGRSLFYRTIYLGVSKAFFIGQLNREHYLRHGIPERKMVRSPYCTVDRVGGLPNEEKSARRLRVRGFYGWSESEVVVGFFGKFIRKKNPDLILDAINLLGDNNVVALLVGSGELESQLRQQGEALGVGRVAFPGFVNQTSLPDYYWRQTSLCCRRGEWVRRGALSSTKPSKQAARS